MIGGQSIFAEEGKALEHDDNNAAMKTLQDEAILESESEEMSKYKSRVDLSQVQQQRGQRVFHKVRFKVRLRRSSKVTDEKATKDGELFKLEKSELLHKGRKYTRKLIVRWYYYKVRKRVKPLGAVETGFKCLSEAGTEAGYKARSLIYDVGVMLPETVEVRRSQVQEWNYKVRKRRLWRKDIVSSTRAESMSHLKGARIFLGVRNENNELRDKSALHRRTVENLGLVYILGVLMIRWKIQGSLR